MASVVEQIRAAGDATRRWAEMIKLVHSVFALPFAVMAAFLAARAAWLAGRHSRPYPSAIELALIVGCMVTARCVAMTFNRIVDARIDACNPRTAARALPAGTIRVSQAVALLLAAAAGFVVCCGGFWWIYGNLLPLILAAPTLAYLCFYSYTKRFTKWSHFVLGSAIAFSPLAAWLAIDPASASWPALLLVGAVTLWIGGFDIIYACQDIAFDRAAGLHSLPAKIGPRRALWIARAAHGGVVLLLAGLVPLSGMGPFYVAGVLIVAALLLIENALVHPDDFSRVNLAFFNINGVISIVLGALTVTDVLLKN